MAYIRGRLTTLSRPVKFSSGKSGEVVDEVWADPRLNNSRPRAPRRSGDRGDRGDFSFGAQRIRWKDGTYDVRLIYYVRRCRSNRWWGPVQNSPSSSPRTIERLMRRTLARRRWFRNENRPR